MTTSVFTPNDLHMIILFFLQLRGAGRWGEGQAPMVFLSEAQQQAVFDSSIHLDPSAIRVVSADAAFEITVEPPSPLTTDVRLILTHDLLRLSRAHRNPRPLTDDQQRLFRDASLQLPQSSGDAPVIQLGLYGGSPLAITVRATARYKSGTFVLESVIDDPIPGFTTGVTWNGWAMPFFTLDVALYICKRFNALNQESHAQLGMSAHFDASENCIVIPDVDNDGEPYRINGVPIETDEGTVMAYAFGEEGWTWEDAPHELVDQSSVWSLPASQRVVALVEAHGDVFQWRRRDGQRGGPFPDEQQAADDAYAHGATHAVSLREVESLGEQQALMIASGGVIPLGFAVQETLIYDPCATLDYLTSCNPLDEYGTAFVESDFVNAALILPSTRTATTS